MEDNLKLYNIVREVPPEAQKKIEAGRLKGKTDINPMWRLKCLTEQFGICGFGWKYEITRQWIEEGSGGVRAAFVNINLYVKQAGEWSEAIPGNGGSSFVSQEKSGMYTSDECYKMALTDAISVACKALGMGADIYWNADTTKYDKKEGMQTTLHISEKRIAVENFLNTNEKYLQNMLNHFNVNDISFLSEKDIEHVYNTYKQRNLL